MGPKPRKLPLQATAVLSSVTSSSPDRSEMSSGVIISQHPAWPDMQFTQGELFFECTLFLYSVLALFLQYLNIYKTLWWLPKSYWHYSMKIHLINPYFLSCVGLLLGWRVTKCFWKQISESVAAFSINRSEFFQSCLTVIEYAFVKTPLMTLIITSFLFSFSRVCHDFPLKSILYVFCPIEVYALMFYAEIWEKIRRIYSSIKQWITNEIDITLLFERFCEPPSAQLDLDSVLHMCSQKPYLRLRVKRSVFAGFSTAFLSIALPCFFVPFKTTQGLPLKILVDETWEWELGFVVALTAFSLYATYLLPLNYLDLLHRSAVHLGAWDPIEGPKVGQTGYANLAPQAWTPDILYNEGETVQTPDGNCYKARSSTSLKVVAAIPGWANHGAFFTLCSKPCTVINCMCLFEGALIVIQFWMLVHTTDWQHIVTLVLLMFANYLLLAKLFKDKVILGRIYEPSPEDIALVQQLQSDMSKAQMDMRLQADQMNKMTDLPEYADLVGCPVEVQFVKGGAGPSTLTGNLYTVDPISNDLVVITFSSDKKPDSMKWIPREAFSKLTAADPETPGCHPKTTELDNFMQILFRKEKIIDPENSAKKKSNLIQWLKRNHVEVKEDGNSLFIFGCVRVEPPFNSEDCFCDNAIILKRVRGMVDKCPV